MTTGAAFPAAFGEIVGAEHVRTGDAVQPFAVDGRAPTWVVAPGDVGEVSRCLALASAAGLAVAPCGAGTRRHWGGALRRLDVVLSLARLDRILAHEPADLTVSVEAGLTLGALDAHVRPDRQTLPLDPPRGARSTVGGLIATGASGPYRARYGTLREMLLGLTVVQGNGTVVKGGGRVVKNATGYDVPKLHVGAMGTLGVVVEAHLRLHPRPAVESTWVFGFTGAERALDAALGLLDTPMSASRVELVDGPALTWTGEVPPAAAALAVTLGSVPEAVRAQGGAVAEVCARHQGRPLAEGALESFWARLGEAVWPTDLAGDLGLRLGTRPTDLAKALALSAAAAREVSAGPPRAIAEVPAGALHVLIPSIASGRAGPLVARLRQGLAALDGTCVVEQGPPADKASLDVWGEVGPALATMRRLKAALDPGDLLNPGRFVGGI